MSLYICYNCEQDKDLGQHGCNPHPSDECECLCDGCFTRILCDDYDDIDMLIETWSEGE